MTNMTNMRVKVTYVWRAYNRVGNIPGLTHRTVNHSLFFVDPVTGVHTQNIESYWNHCKVKLKRKKGVHQDMLAGYLDEFMWKERAVPNIFDTILQEIGRQHPQYIKVSSNGA